MNLTDFSVLSFDCYGTLIDWETGILQALKPLVARAHRSELSPDDVLAVFARHEAVQEHENPGLRYDQLLAAVHQNMAIEWGVGTQQQESATFGASVGSWPAFADSAESLSYFKRHYRLVVLSNVDRHSFAGSQAQLAVDFDDVFTAEEIGSYKPDARNFEYMLKALQAKGIAKAEILHTAQSLFHDHAPANEIGLTSAWINRRFGRPAGGATLSASPMPHLDFEFVSLTEMMEAHKREVSARPRQC